MRRILIALFCAGLLLAAGREARAQDATAQTNRTGHVDFGLGFGPMLSTESGSIIGVDVSGNYFLTNELSVGPLLQMGFDDSFNQIGLSAQVKYMFDLAANPKVHPHLEAGFGLIYANDGRSETEFLLPFGGGVDVEVAKRLFLNSTLLLNVSGLRDDLYVNWIFGFRVEM